MSSNAGNTLTEPLVPPQPRSSKKKWIMGGIILVVIVGTVLGGFFVYQKFFAKSTKEPTKTAAEVALQQQLQQLQQQQQQMQQQQQQQQPATPTPTPTSGGSDQDCVYEVEFPKNFDDGCGRGCVQEGVLKIVQAAKGKGKPCPTSTDLVLHRNCCQLRGERDKATYFFGNVDYTTPLSADYYKVQTDARVGTASDCLSACLNNLKCVSYIFSTQRSGICSLYLTPTDGRKDNILSEEFQFVFEGEGVGGTDKEYVGFRIMPTAKINTEGQIFNYYKPVAKFNSANEIGDAVDPTMKFYNLTTVSGSTSRELKFGTDLLNRPMHRWFQDDSGRYTIEFEGFNNVQCAEMARIIRDAVGYRINVKAITDVKSAMQNTEEPPCSVFLRGVTILDQYSGALWKKKCFKADSVDSTKGAVTTGSSGVKCTTDQGEPIIDVTDVLSNNYDDYFRDINK